MENQGEIIAKLRKKAGLTQSELGFECGWGKSRLSNYEQGARKPKLDDLETIAKTLDKHLGAYTIVELVTGKPLSELAEQEGFANAGKFKIENAIAVFTSFISDAVEFGEVKLRPNLTQMSLVRSFSASCVQVVETSSGSKKKKAR